MGNGYLASSYIMLFLNIFYPSHWLYIERLPHSVKPILSLFNGSLTNSFFFVYVQFHRSGFECCCFCLCLYCCNWSIGCFCFVCIVCNWNIACLFTMLLFPWVHTYAVVTCQIVIHTTTNGMSTVSIDHDNCR